MQNKILAAHSLGLDAIWRTGEPCYDPEMKKLFGLRERGEVTGFIYMGFTEITPPIGKRKHYSEVTKWIKSEFE